MTLNDINKILSRLAENPTRENILDFSFALLQWMNIEPNTGNKPQLLSPQTQKLKDFLATAPQTVQPQLYRISADNQNIRIRFAVLKKLKKEYISQLVDNDPGLSSYQTFVKGLTPQGNGTTFIPTQPYFIHFVTTPDYDKLVLIFNQGEQKRIVSFRNRLTNTQYNKIILLWQSIGTKSKPEIADLLWKSLDIKEVNKEFYKQVKERFDALLGIVKTQHSTATENQIKQFTVRLIGRYIFCWFLKEKGIIPHSLISKETIEKTDNYYQNALLKLFFETLNTKVQDRNPLTLNKLFEKIPYLNGGLFDESEEDKLFIKLKLDAWLLPFVEILESYDFTVDESSSQYQQVAVDPEMLGRIFENLLASQNEETEKLANQRKAFGAFYTPREIVDYMVNESIKAFLQTQWEQHIIEEKSKSLNNPEQAGDIFGNKKPQQLVIETKRYELKPEEKNKIEKALENLFTSNPDAVHLKKDEKNLLLNFLEQIKILDPACGSGAFPMGILHKLVELNEVLGTVKSSYELKKDILSQNIYGVDIMPMAIEIARLRAWLSLVLEEDYKPADPKHNFGVKPLPNLDFKFVCANSLIDLGLDAFIQESKGTLHEGFTKKLITQLKALEDLRKQFFTPALASTEKEKLKTEYLQKRNEVVAAIEADSDPVLRDIAKKIKHWNPFDDSHPSPFFSPTWMFGIDTGFDVVIGNPPYVQIQKMLKELKSNFLLQNYESYSSMGDIYSLFYERGYNLLRTKGILIYITSNKWLKVGYGDKIRKFFSTNAELHNLLDFGSIPIFESVTVDTNILSFSKGISNQSITACGFQNDWKEGQSTIRNYFKEKAILLKGLNDKPWIVGNSVEETVKEKIKKFGKPLLSWDIKIYRGVLTGFNEAFIIDEATKNELIKKDPKNIEIIKPILLGKDIKRYSHSWKNRYIINSHNGLKSDGLKPIDLKNDYPILFSHLEKYEAQLKARQDQGDNWWNLRNCAYLKDFTKPKITWGNLALDSQFSFVKEDIFINAPSPFFVSDNMYLLAILNSKVGSFYIKSFGVSRSGGYVEFKPMFVEQLPIPDISSQSQFPFITIVEKILFLKKKNQDTTSLEKEIDVMVYKLYELSYEEVKIIDKDFWLSEEEYEKIKIV